MLTRSRRQALLTEEYWTALRADRAAAPPEELDSEVAETLAWLRSDAARLRPDTTTIAFQRRKLAAQLQQTSSKQRVWSGPAVDFAEKRRAARAIKESEEQLVRSEFTRAVHQPTPLRRRGWARAGLKIAATIVVFAAVGVLLAIVLRNYERQAQVAQPGPTSISSPEY